MHGTDFFIFSILIGGGIAIVRFSSIRKEYYPFIFIIWLACINELLNTALVLTNHFNIINSNIYSLAEGLLYLWFFQKIGTFRRFSFLRYILSALFIGVWVTENFILNRFGTNFNSYFIIFADLTLVLLAITTINNIVITEKEVRRNPTFLICIAVVVFFTYAILVEAFWIYGIIKPSGSFTNNVYAIVAWINLLCNLIYAVAILWMRKKREFTVQF